MTRASGPSDGRRKRHELELAAASPPQRPKLDIPHALDSQSPPTPPAIPPPFFPPPVSRVEKGPTQVPPRPKKRKHVALVVTLSALIVMVGIGLLFVLGTIPTSAGANETWTKAQEVVRRHTGLPRNQILSPFPLERVRIWGGPRQDVIYSKLQLQTEIFPESWLRPDGQGVFVIAINGSPSDTVPQTKTGYFVDANEKIRMTVSEDDIVLDGRRIDTPDFPSFIFEKR